MASQWGRSYSQDAGPSNYASYSDSRMLDVKPGSSQDTPDASILSEDDDDSIEDLDTEDDPDERIRNPTLWLLKLWRKVSPQGPIYHTYRDPTTMRYSATLYLVLPPNNQRLVFEVKGYPTKRSAKTAASEKAIAANIEEKARQSGFVMDRIGTENEPIFKPRPRPKRDERFNIAEELSNREEETALLAQNPVTALNLAVQRYCVETPTQALLFEHTSTPHAVVNYRLHGCKLTVRITPDLHETYTLVPQYTSAKIAKEAVTRLALQDGVITLLKLHNSYTARVCRQMGLPIPSVVEDHDPVDEENTAGMLGQLVQEVTRSPTAMQCAYSTSTREGAEYHGAVLTIDLRDGDRRTYRLEPCAKSKKEAKETICRLAVRSGIKTDLLSQKRLMDATKTILTRLSTPTGTTAPSAAPKPGTVAVDDVDYLENAVTYLNLSLQAFTGQSDGLRFEFTEIAPRSTLGRGMGTRFGCTLIVRLQGTRTRSFTVEPEFPSKKAAKESAAKLAIKSKVVDEAKAIKTGAAAASATPEQTRARNAGYPTFSTAAEASASFSRTSDEAYTAPVNTRASIFRAPPSDAEDVDMVSPPPYIDTRRQGPAPQPSSTIIIPSLSSTTGSSSTSSNPLIARHAYLPRAADSDAGSSSGTAGTSSLATSAWGSPPSTAPTSRLHSLKGTPLGPPPKSTASSGRQSTAERVHVNALASHLENAFGEEGRQYVRYAAYFEPDLGLWRALCYINLPGHDTIKAEVDARYWSDRMAEEAAAQRAIDVHGAIAKIDARKRTTSNESASGSAPVPANDPFAQPVSYLQQVCQVLLSTDLADLPKYELTKKEGGALYGAILTVQTEPVSIYRTDMIHASKAAAKEAVTRAALEADLVQKLKDTMIIRKTAATAPQRDSTPVASSSGPVAAGSANERDPKASEPPPPPFTERLDEYCRFTHRPAPQWTVTTQGSSSTSEAVDLSVKIANETFQLDGSKKSEAAGREKLAKMVLKHIRKRDEQAASADQQITTTV